MFVWSAEKSLHDPTLLQLQKNKKVPTKIDINRVDLVLGGLAKLTNGELTYDPSVIDVDLDSLLDAAKSKRPLPANRIPPPYKTADEFKAALPAIEKSYRFTGDYLSEFSQSNPFVRLMRSLGMRTLP